MNSVQQIYRTPLYKKYAKAVEKAGVKRSRFAQILLNAVSQEGTEFLSETTDSLNRLFIFRDAGARHAESLAFYDAMRTLGAW